MARLEQRRLGDGTDDLILGLKYLKTGQAQQGLASYVVLKDRIGPKVQNMGQLDFFKQ